MSNLVNAVVDELVDSDDSQDSIRPAHVSVPVGFFNAEGTWSPVSTKELTAMGRILGVEKKLGADGKGISIRSQVEERIIKKMLDGVTFKDMTELYDALQGHRQSIVDEHRKANARAEQRAAKAVNATITAAIRSMVENLGRETAETVAPATFGQEAWDAFNAAESE